MDGKTCAEFWDALTIMHRADALRDVFPGMHWERARAFAELQFEEIPHRLCENGVSLTVQLSLAYTGQGYSLEQAAYTRAQGKEHFWNDDLYGEYAGQGILYTPLSFTRDGNIASILLFSATGDNESGNVRWPQNVWCDITRHSFEDIGEAAAY